MNKAFGEMVPVCCGKRMSVRFANAKFLELRCSRCDDLVYVKKTEVS